MVKEIENSSQTQLAYAELKKRIETCYYLPGQEIYEKQLNTELSYGRTPIREALLVLQRDGLLQIYPRKGMQVKPILSEDINHLFQIRKIIEPQVSVDFCNIYSKDRLLNFEQLFEEEHLNHGMDLESDLAFYSLDIRFHTYLIEITQNPILIKLYNKLLDEVYRVAVYGAKIKSSRREDNFDQHKRIIKALLEENREEIRESMNSHLNFSHVASLQSITASPSGR